MKKAPKILISLFLSLVLINSNMPFMTNTSFFADAAEVNSATVPEAPTNLYSVHQKNTSISLCWDSVMGVDEFNVYNGSTRVNAVPVNSWFYEVTGLKQNTAYTFTVKSVNEFGESAASTAITVKTQNWCFTYIKAYHGVIISGYTGTEKDITIPEILEGNYVTGIGNNAFANYTALENLTIPYSVESIGSNAFENCNNLTIHAYTNSYAHTFATENSIPFVARDLTYSGDYAVGDGVLWNYRGYDAAIVIPNNLGITEVGEYAFVDIFSLNSMTIPSGVTTIGANAFSYCFDLNSIIIPNSVTKIGECAFNGCGKLTILCDFGSCAHAYAMNNNLNYRLNNASELPITIEDEFAFGINDEQTLSKLKGKFSVDITIKDNKGNALTESSLIGTGSVISCNGMNLTVIIKGEISGDGKVDARDYLLVKRAFLQTFTLSDVQLKAACLEGTALPTAKDYLKIKRHFLGSYSLYE